MNATAAELTIHHAALQALPRLRKLICSKAVPADQIGGAHWEVSWHAAPGLGGRRRQRWWCLWLPCPQLHYIGHLCQCVIPCPLQQLVRSLPEGCVVEELSSADAEDDEE